MSGRTAQQVGQTHTWKQGQMKERQSHQDRVFGVIPKGELYLWDNLVLSGFGSLCPFTKEVTHDNEILSPSEEESCNIHFVPRAGHSTMNRSMHVLMVPSVMGDSAQAKPGLGQLAQLGRRPRPALAPTEEALLQGSLEARAGVSPQSQNTGRSGQGQCGSGGHQGECTGKIWGGLG